MSTMEVFDPLFSYDQFKLLSSDGYRTFKQTFEEMVQASDFMSNTESILSYSRPMALKFLILGAMFSWRSEGLDSSHIFDDQRGNVEMMQLEKVSYGSGWELRSFLFSFDPNSRPNFPSGYVNMNHLIDTLSRRMGKTPQEASEMVSRALEQCKFVSFDDLSHVTHEILPLKIEPYEHLHYEDRKFNFFRPMPDTLQLKELNYLFTMQGAEAIQKERYFTAILRHYMDYLNIIFGPGHKEYYLDFVHGILLNVQNKFSLRIHRTQEYRDLAIGTKNALLEASANIIYIQQERAVEYGPSSFTVPNSWETFQRQCINWKIQSSDLIYEVVPIDSIPVKNYLDEQNIQVRKLMKMLKYRVDVHWPEVYLGELLAMKMTEAKYVFIPTDKGIPLVDRRFSFMFERNGEKTLINVVEYHQDTNSRQRASVPEFLLHQDGYYNIYNLDILSPKHTRSPNAHPQLLSFRKERKLLSQVGPAEAGNALELNNVLPDLDLVNDLFTEPGQTCKRIIDAVNEFWPSKSWKAERVSSFFKGFVALGSGIHFYDDVLNNPQIMHVLKGPNERGLIVNFPKAAGVNPSAEKEYLELRSNVRLFVENNMLPTDSINPRIVVLKLNRKHTGLVASKRWDSDLFDQCQSRRRKRSTGCELDEETAQEERSESRRLLEEEIFVKKFKPLEKLQTALEKEEFQRNSKSKNLQRATRWSNTLMQLQIGKDILGAMIEGDWKGVAFNTGFLIGSTLLSQVGGKLTNAGQITKSLGRVALGNSMLVGGPILSRLPSAFLAFDLYRQWHAFKKGDEGAIVGVIADGVAIANDVTAVALEVLVEVGLVAEISWPAAPIGALIFLGLDIYNSIKMVNRIDDLVNLSKWEKAKEFFLAFLHISPTSYIQHLLDEKSRNDFSMDEFAERFKCSKDVTFYTQPAQYVKSINCRVEKNCFVTKFNPHLLCPEHKVCDNTLVYFENNFADFRMKKTMFSRTFPKSIDNFELQCSNATTVRETDDDQSRNIYSCSDMIGVKIHNATSNISFIEVGTGNDFIYGYEETDNVIRIGGGKKQIVAGWKADLFILYGDAPITGSLDGSGGPDELNLLLYNIKTALKIEPTENNSTSKLTTHCTYCTKHTLLLSSIEKITGRAGMQEIVHADCNLEEIVLKGGTNEQPDLVVIDDSPNCQKNLNVIIEGPFQIENKATSGNFRYLVGQGHKTQTINLDTGKRASNLITFNYSLTEVRDITHLNVSNLEMYLSEKFNFTYRGTTDSTYTFDRILSFWFDDDLKDGPQTHIPFKSNNSLIQFFFADNVTMVHNGSKIMAFKEAHQEALDDLIETYSPVANKLHIHMVLNVGKNKTKVFIRHGSYRNTGIEKLFKQQRTTLFKQPINVMTNDLDSETHLVAGITENLFLIRAQFVGTDQFFSKHFPTKALNELITIETVNNVLMIDTEERSLKPKPVHYSNQTEVIIITAADEIDHLIIDHRINNVSFIKCNQSLLINSNIVEQDQYKNVDKGITVTLLKYFDAMAIQRKMFNNLRFDFINHSFILIDELEKSQNLFNMCW